VAASAVIPAAPAPLVAGIAAGTVASASAAGASAGASAAESETAHRGLRRARDPEEWWWEVPRTAPREAREAPWVTTAERRERWCCGRGAAGAMHVGEAAAAAIVIMLCFAGVPRARVWLMGGAVREASCGLFAFKTAT